MSMDKETRTLLRALVDGQVKLAESHAALETNLARSHAALETKLAKSHAALAKEIAQSHAQLAKAQARTEATVDRLGHNLDRLASRLDDFRKDVYRGFTRSVARDHSLDRRVTTLERSRRT